MLTELSIKNLAVIEGVELHFRQGFQVLTGETGAGKSIIIDALSLIVGGRASSDLVRYGSDKAEIEAMFDLESTHPVWAVIEGLGIEAASDESLLIRREITSSGKSSSRINGQLVNQSMLKEVGAYLVNIHGQHEHQSLLKTEEHIDWLDLYGDREIDLAKKLYIDVYNRYSELQKELKELSETNMQSLRMADLYRFQVEEITAAELKIGEDEELLEERKLLANAEKLYQNASEAYDFIYGGNRGLDAIRKANQRLQDITALDSVRLQPLLEQMQSAFYQLEDAAYQLRDYREGIEFNPARLDQIEQRLDLINNLRRKYGDSISEILNYLKSITHELDLIDNKDEKIQKLQATIMKQEVELIQAARDLSDQRKSLASKLASDIESELRGLGMERTRLEVQITDQEDPRGVEVDGRKVRLTKDGWDIVEFLISPNPGEPLRGLAKIASGGELSRIMLAMKTIFARLDRIPVLVFDEVDTGVSGRAAQAIAEKMSQLAGYCQVFSITHLPQVACMADSHFLIHKEIDGERTFTRVTDMNEDGRMHELARMLGGVEVTETTLHHAKEMIALAKAKKHSR